MQCCPLSSSSFTLIRMPVPDAVIFGPNVPSGQLTYGTVRKLPVEEKFTALQRRLGAFFISQVEELGKAEGGVAKVYSPFPLFLMTCIGIETMGKVFFWRETKNKETKEDIQREGFLEICQRLHKHFPRKLTKKDKAAYNSLWGEDAHKNASTYSLIIYRLGRNTMVHGYRGKGVYLTEDISEWSFEKGALIINPYWLWRAFKNVYEDLWIQMYANKEPKNPMKIAVLNYLDELLG